MNINILHWSTHPLKVLCEFKPPDKILTQECYVCHHIYAIIASSIKYDYLHEKPDDLPTICYHCEKDILDTVEKRAARKLAQDNVRTIRDALQVIKDSVELEDNASSPKDSSYGRRRTSSPEPKTKRHKAEES